jgi:hypothetical protein
MATTTAKVTGEAVVHLVQRVVLLVVQHQGAAGEERPGNRGKRGTRSGWGGGNRGVSGRLGGAGGIGRR